MPALSPAASFVFAFLLCIVVGTALVVQQQSCPEECRSFVSLGNSVGQAVIGPSVSLSWSVKQATTTTVQQVAVVVHVLSQEDTFVLNSTFLHQPFTVDIGGVVGGGSITLLTGDGLGEVPQLRVDYAGTTYTGSQGGFNGSVAIFDTNVPNLNNSQSIGPVRFAWTACFANNNDGAIYRTVTNSTVWTQLQGLWVGASYVSAFDNQAVVSAALGGANVTATFSYSNTGIFHKSVVCIDSVNCYQNGFELFSSLSCPPASSRAAQLLELQH